VGSSLNPRDRGCAVLAQLIGIFPIVPLRCDVEGKDRQAVLFAALSTRPCLDHGDFAIV
jgi:hypothetical protein